MFNNKLGKKEVVIATAVVLLVVLTIVVMLIAQYQGSKQKTTSTGYSPNNAPTKILIKNYVASKSERQQTTQALRKEASRFIAPDGRYYGLKNCDNSNCIFMEDNRIASYPLHMLYLLYKKTNDVMYLDEIRNIAETYSDPDKVPTIQPSQWHCKLLFEVWSDGVIQEVEIKNNIKDMCARAQYAPRNYAQFQRDISKYPVLYKPLTDASIANLTSEELPTEWFTEYSSYASEYATMYRWGADPEDLMLAKLYQHYSEQNFLNNRSDPYMLGSIGYFITANIDLYKASGEISYLQTAEYLLKSAQVSFQDSEQIVVYLYSVASFENVVGHSVPFDKAPFQDKLLSYMTDNRLMQNNLSLKNEEYSLMVNSLFASILLQYEEYIW